MIEKIDNLLNKINLKGLKVIHFLMVMVCLLSANMLLIRGLYDGLRSIHFGINVIIEINVWYIFAYFLYYEFKKHQDYSSRQILEQIFGFLAILNLSIPILLEPSPTIAAYFDISFLYSLVMNLVGIMSGIVGILYLYFLQKIKE
jgi:hypothetical protein